MMQTWQLTIDAVCVRFAEFELYGEGPPHVVERRMNAGGGRSVSVPQTPSRSDQADALGPGRLGDLDEEARVTLPPLFAILGWPAERVLVIDEDQGTSGKTAESRSGFQRLMAEVSLNHVGIVLGFISVEGSLTRVPA